MSILGNPNYVMSSLRKPGNAGFRNLDLIATEFRRNVGVTKFGQSFLTN